MSNLDLALAYAQRGWHVFPLVPGTKIPLKGTHGRNSATTDETQIREWWWPWGPGGDRYRYNAEHNIGINTELSKLVVIDIDVPKNGEDTVIGEDGKPVLFGMAAWMFMLGNVGLTSEPKTYEVDTPSGGTHLYWQANRDLIVSSNSSGKLAPGIDVMAVGGQITAAGSTKSIPNESATGTGDVYSVRRERDPLPLPPWLRRLLRSKGLATSEAERRAAPVREPARITNGNNYAEAALAGELQNLREAQGSRNAAINTAAFKLKKFCDAGQLDPSRVQDEILRAALDLGTPDREATYTIKRALGL